MVERSHPRPDASTTSRLDVTAQPGILSPPTPDHKHPTASPGGRESHSPRQPAVTPHESPVMDVRPGRLKRRAPPSRESSPGSTRSTSPRPPAISSVLEKLEVLKKKVGDASTPQLSPPSPPPSRHKFKQPAACPPSPSASDADATSLRSASPDRSDDDSLHSPPHAATPHRSTPLVPPAKQLEIDAVIARLPPVAPPIEPDTTANIATDDRLQVDEGFYDESAESHYQAFARATEELRSKRRPYYRVRTPGAEKGSALVQRSVVRKSIRMRKREPKGRACVGGDGVASSSGT